MDKTSLTLGWLAGRRIAGQRTKRKVITGYCYNGTVLPALPEWDREMYPHVILLVRDGIYFLWFRTTETTLVTPTDSGTIYCGLTGNDTLQLTEGVWSETSNWNPYNTPVWTSADIYYSDDEDNGELSGTLYLAASEPLPTDNGKMVYGGVKLPPLPEWDKVTYPYALIVTTTDTESYRLYISDKPVFYRRIDEPNAVCLSAACKLGMSGIMYQNHPSMDGAVWSDPYVMSIGGASPWYDYASSYVWANHDLLWDDGTVALSASDPIPVYA